MYLPFDISESCLVHCHVFDSVSCVLGLTSSIILKNGRLYELIAQLQELLKGVDEVEIATYKYDSALLAAQVLQIIFSFFALTLSSNKKWVLH